MFADSWTHEERVAFDMYFASLCSMQVHPGAGTKGQRALSITECRDKAIEMVRIRKEVVEDRPCLGE